MSALAICRAAARRAGAIGRGSSLCLLVYLALHLALGLLRGDHGLLTPDGHLAPVTAALTLSALVLRLALLFVLGPLLIYRLVAPRAAPASARTSSGCSSNGAAQGGEPSAQKKRESSRRAATSSTSDERVP